MKIISYLMLAVLAISLNACQKEGSVEMENPSSGTRLKRYTEVVDIQGLSDSSTFDVGYDNSGRIISLVSTTDAGYRFAFGYPAPDRHTIEIFTNGKLGVHAEMYRNSQALLDSAFQYNDTDDSSTSKYIYDANKRVVAIKDYDYTKQGGSILSETTRYMYDAAGDMIRSITSDGTESVYEYYTDARYETPFALAFTGPELKGKHHLVKKRTLKEPGGTTISVEHTYKFDAQQRVIEDKGVIPGIGSVTKTFTFL